MGSSKSLILLANSKCGSYIELGDRVRRGAPRWPAGVACEPTPSSWRSLMSLRPIPDFVVPTETARVARAAFPNGTRCLRIADRLGTVFRDADFASLFPPQGQPALTPVRLALV